MNTKRGGAFTALGFILVLVVAVSVMSPAAAARETTAVERAAQHAPDLNAVYDTAPYETRYGAVVQQLSDEVRIAALETVVADLSTRVAVLEGGTKPPATQTPSPSPVPTGTPAPTETAQPSETPTALPTATPDHDHTAVNRCGVPLDQWWTATEPSGCQNGSERGDAPPTWVRAYESQRGRSFGMHGPNLTSATEASMKYMVMKGYAFTVPVVRPRNVNVDVYCVIHGGSVPFERAQKVHSWRCWFREGDTGAISAIQGWYRAPGFGFERIPGFDGTANRNNFPIIFGPSRASVAAGGPQCEQWYVGAPGREPNIEFGLTFCGTVAYLQPGETNQDFDVSKWDLSGSPGTTRRLELVYYRTTRPDNQRTGFYWSLQNGVPVSGPNDPACSGSVVIANVSYPALCLEQNVSPTLPEISFTSTNGRNSFQRSYPNVGVVAPN